MKSKVLIAELRTLDAGALATRAKELAEELFRIRCKAVTEPVATSHRISQIKRDIARVLTVLNEKSAEKVAA